jgi:diguanylate cyclase (GGDEF)-like protein
VGRRLAALYRDPLTGLPLRSTFMRAVRREVADPRPGCVTGVLYVDLDGLKRVNDTLGHDGGDEVLREVADRLSAALGPRDVAARLGGDEFGVLVRRREDVAEVHATAEAVLSSIAAPWPAPLALIDEPATTASIGLAVHDGPGVGDEQTADDLIRSADLAMFSAKRRGGGQVEVFSAQRVMTAASERRHAASVAEAVEHALANETLELRYQPVYCVRCGEAVRVEALLRVLGPDGRAHSPGRLVSAAEATGRLDRLTAWVLACALDDARMWWDTGCQVPVAVNLSSAELAVPSGAAEVLSAVRRSTLPPGALVLDVHRSDGASDLAGLRDGVAGLSAAGVAVVLEDVETAWPPVELAAVAPDGLSLCRASLDAAADDPAMAATVEAVLHLADSIGSSVTAKTIETAAQLEAAVRAGCAFVQGTLLSPVTVPDGLAWRTSHLTMRDGADPVLTGVGQVATVHPCTTAFSYADRALAETQRPRDPSSPLGPGGFSRPRDHYDSAEET